MTWNERYRQSKFNYLRRRSEAFFVASGGEKMKVMYPKVTSTNGLTKAVIDILTWDGHLAERTNNQGRMVDQTITYTDILGHRRTIGSLQWQKGTGTNGTSDIKADISHPAYRFPIPVKIEIKWNKDRQSDVQKDYQQSVESKGGVYVIVKNIEGFYSWYDAFMLSL